MKLQHKMILFFSTIIIIIIGGLAVLIFRKIDASLELQMGNNAMDLAVTIAALQDVQKGLAFQIDQEEINKYIENIRVKTRFQYIIVMDMNGVQYSYPYESGLGKVYRNGGESRVLSTGESYVSADRNVLISAIRAFTPVYYEGKQVGAVLVGLLHQRVDEENKKNRNEVELILAIGIILGVLSAVFLSYNIKKSIYGLEPKEIALLLGQRDLILQNIVRGILAVDRDGKIILYNETARNTFHLSEDAVGENINQYSSKLTDVILNALTCECNIVNNEIRLGPTKILLISICPMRNTKAEIIGVVASFEDLTEAKKLAEELIGYKSLINALRAQNHEFMNKLHIISGMLQLGRSKEAMIYIEKISEGHSRFSGTINKHIKNTYVAAILLAKYNKLKEEKIDMVIDPESYFPREIEFVYEDELCSVIGNLIDNAEEALIGHENARVDVYINVCDDEIQLVVEDNGKGIPKELEESIFEQGVTTKEGSRGFGLHIVKDIVDNLGGKIHLKNSEGVSWDIRIPLNGQEE